MLSCVMALIFGATDAEGKSDGKVTAICLHHLSCPHSKDCQHPKTVYALRSDH